MSGLVESEVREGALAEYDSDALGRVSLNRMGHKVGNDWVQDLVNQGRGFNFAQITPDTLLTASTSYAATDPSIILVIPQGTVMIPFYCQVSFEDADGVDNHVIIGYDTGDLFVSGGIAGSALNNLRADSPYTSVMKTAKNGDTAIVMTDPGAGERIVFHYTDAFPDVDTSPAGVIPWEPKRVPVLVGPATLFVHIYAGGTAQEYQYQVKWVEIPAFSFVA